MINRHDYQSAPLPTEGVCEQLPLTRRPLSWPMDGWQETAGKTDPLLRLKRYYWRFLKLKAFVLDYQEHWLAPSYSQEGEDLVLRRMFDGQRTGFFVDVGAHHPKRYSNTYYFYINGWRGINVDAAPGSMQPFSQARPRDINVEAAVASENKALTFYEFDEPTLIGFCKDISLNRHENGPYKIVGERQIETVTLTEVLDRCLPAGQRIDFLNVDVEGLDLDVLASNDWTKYQPTVVLAEDLTLTSMRDLDKSPVVCLMQQQGYELYCKVVNTLIFRKIDRALSYERHAKFE
jgi:FkbM family methyltransferase